MSKKYRISRITLNDHLIGMAQTSKLVIWQWTVQHYPGKCEYLLGNIDTDKKHTH